MAPGREDLRQGARDAGALLLLAADQGDALAILAQARDHIAVFSLRLVLVLRGLHKAAADQHHRAACQQGVDDSRDYEKPGNMDLPSPDSHIEGAANGPQHDDERRGRQQGLGHAADKIHRRLGRDPHIVGDAVLRIGVIAGHQVELIVPAVREPPVDHAIADPGAPLALQCHAHVDLRDAQEDADRQNREIEQGQFGDCCSIAGLQPIEHRAVPGVHRVCGANQQDDDQQEGR